MSKSKGRLVAEFLRGLNSDGKLADAASQIADSTITSSKLAPASLITESEGIGNNDNDTTLPTSAAVKDYVDNNAGGSGAGVTVYATLDNLPAASSVDEGSMALVDSTNRLYIQSDNGWYNIALVNTTPSISVPSASYDLASDGTATTVAITATDPEGIPITYSIASDTSGSIATVTQGTGSNTHIFTITPSTNTAHAGTFSLTFRASDGVNLATAVSSFTLVFTVDNSRYTTALVTSVGANNAVNNSFDDASSNNHTITKSGDATQVTFSPYRHGGYSIYGDGSDAVKFTETSSNEFTFGTGDFTIEFWVWLDYASIANQAELTLAGNNGTDGELWFAVTNYGNSASGGEYNFQIGTGGWATTVRTSSSNANKLRQWVHLAVTCKDVSGTRTINIWENGTSVVSGTTTVNIPNTNSQLSFLGRPQTHGQYTKGYMHDVRVTKGSAVYTSNFTAPDELLDSGTNTVLSSLRGPILRDESDTVANGVVAGGDPSMLPFTAYDRAPYSASTHAGSVRLDGSGDYLTTATSSNLTLGTGDWTVEGWMYTTQASDTQHLFDCRDSDTQNRPSLYLSNSNGWTVYVAGATKLDDVGTVVPNFWHHFALVKNGSTTTLYVDGASAGSYSDSYNSDNDKFTIGGRFNGADPLHGHLADFRVVKGTAVYTGAFTPPSGGLTLTGGTYPSTTNVNTSITSGHTVLHIPFTNGGIIDKSQSAKHVALYGDVKSSTTQTKHLSSSMYFDGSDYIRAEYQGLSNFGTKPFTIEGWFYLTVAPSNYITLVQSRNLSSSTTGWEVTISASDFYFDVNGSVAAKGSAISQNTWYHYAVTRDSSNNVKLFLDGTQVGSTASNITNDFTLDIFWIGAKYNAFESGGDVVRYFTGYMSDVRLTKGHARYTSNFTAPTAALQG